MIRGIHQSARNLHQKMKNMEIVAQNLANISTNGYKRELPFSEIMNRFKDNRYKQVTDFTQGPLNETGNPLDIAVSGGGFFVVETPEGLALTRNGNFTITDDGDLVTKEGYRVMGKGGPVNLQSTDFDQAKAISITSEGDIKIGDVEYETLRIAHVEDQVALERGPDGTFFTDGRMYEDADPSSYQVSQGFLEESNVNPILEMQEMININSDYEASQKLIGAYDATYGKSMEIGRV